MSKICTAEQAVSDIQSGQVVASVGVIGWITPDDLLKALAARFVSEQTPRDLTFYFPCGTGDGVNIRGMDHVAIEGLMKRIVSGSYINPINPATGKRPELMRLIRENRIEAYSWPIGASMHWLREVARKSPGYITRVGLGTYADPRQTGGKFTDKATQDLIRVIKIDDEEFLYYPTWKLDVAFIRASSADEDGNLSFEDEPIQSSSLQLALAVKACGGTVVAQVRRIVPRSSRPAHIVKVPGALVDRIVVCPDQMMGTDIAYDASYLGGSSWDDEVRDKIPLSAHKAIARRVACEIKPGITSIFGFGASSDAPLILMEDGDLSGGRIRDYKLTTEHGPFGGIVMSGWQFSANKYPEALLDGVTQFDFIDGGGCSFAALAFAQFDANGNVNVSRFSNVNPGAGGFIDIAYSAQELVFAGTFTTGGFESELRDGRISITREGKVKKFAHVVEQITYPVLKNVRERGQKAKIVTERAVFEVLPEGLVLTEIAEGMDVRKDILDQMEYAPAKIAPQLQIMSHALYS